MSPPPAPRAALAARLFVAMAVAFLIFGALAQLADIPFGLVWTEVFLFFAPAWVLACALTEQPQAWLRLGRPRALPVVLGALVGLANYPLTAALEVVVRSWAVQRWPAFVHQSDIGAATLGAVHGGLRAVLVLAIGICAPLGEETAFRGFIQRTFLGRFGPAGAIALTGFLFSAIHYEPIGGLARFELGVLFGVLVLWTGSVWTSIAAHAANNLFAVGLYYALGQSGDDAPPKAIELLQLMALGIGLVVPLLYLVKRFAPPAEERTFTEPMPVGSTARIWAAAGLGSWAALIAASIAAHHFNTQIAR